MLSYKTVVSVLMVGILLAGCTTGPDYARPDLDTPTEWNAKRAGGEVDKPVDVSAWWNALGDPALDALVNRAVIENHDLKLAEARVREARAARGIAASALWPSLNASGGWTRSSGPEQDLSSGSGVTFGANAGATGLSRSITYRNDNLTLNRSVSAAGAMNSASYTPGDTTIDPTTNLFQAGFDASWELDIFGGNRRGVEAANADIDAAVESQRDVLVSLLSEVARNYIELRESQNRLDITNHNIKSQQDTVALTRDRFTAGLSSELDAIRAESLLATTMSQVPLLETQVDASIHRLSVLLGQEPSALFAELAASKQLPLAPDAVPVGLPSDLLRRRPDIRRSERELAASTARIGEAEADLFPKFYLTGAFAGQDASFGSIFNGPNQLWSIGPSFSWPIFQGGRIRANINVQNARQEQAAISYEQSILLALEEVENGLVSFAKEQVRRSALEDAVRANEQAVALANERYVRGLADFLNVLESQRSLFLSQDSLVQSQSTVLTNLVALYKALGGGWETFSPEVPVVETASAK